MENQNNINLENKNEKVIHAENQATLSLILGIVAIAISTVVGIICGAIAMKKSRLAKEILPNNNFAAAGHITGLIGLIIGIVTTVTTMIIVIISFIVVMAQIPILV